MEHIANIKTQLAGTTNGLTNVGNSLERSSQNTTRNKAYLANCIELVDKTIRLANQPPLSTSDSLLRAKEWQDAIEPNVPLSRLPATFARALRNHTSSFPVNAFDMLSAWNQLAAEDAVEREQRYQAERSANPVQHCAMSYNHINEDGDIEIVLGGPTGKTVVIPCSECRTEHSFRRLAEEKAKFTAEHPGFEPLPIIDEDNVFDLLRAAKPDRPKPKSAIGILLQAKLDGGDGERLSNAIDYIKRWSQPKV